VTKRSAGLLLYRTTNDFLELFLVHPGGPFFARKDLGAWSIPKGEFEMEDPLAAARREFKEETGFDIAGEFVELAPIKQKGGKFVYAWAVEADLDPSKIKSNTFKLEWPPKTGKMAEYPEVDRGAWFSIEEARQKILSSQESLISDLLKKL
jgi:predicted NUDIX family NTP pyrophosphohydrolase